MIHPSSFENPRAFAGSRAPLRAVVPLWTILLLFACVATTPAQPASTGPGELAGQVSNAVTRASLQGASVELVGTGRTTLTDASGQFSFRNLPAGSYTVAVAYAGLDRVSETVAITSGGRASLNVALTSAVYQLDAFTVTADREGQAASITRQRTAGNIINVVSLDAYGDVADGNLGNFLEKLPGVAIHYNDGDPVGVMFRGAPPSMSMITLDGTQLPAAASGNTGSMGDRAPVIDRTPAEFIKEVEVTKASTPDMDATGLGGAAKLITKSAFDFKQTQVLSFQGSYNLNTYRRSNPWTPSAALTYMRKFGPENRLAVTLSGSYTKVFGARDRVQPNYPATSDMMSGLRFLDDTHTTIRQGGGAKFEYRPDATLSLYADVLLSDFSKDLTRYNHQIQSAGALRVADYSRVSRAQIEAGTAPRDATNQTAGIAPGGTNDLVEWLHTNWINQVAIEPRRNDQIMLAAGGTKRLADWELTGRVTKSYDDYERAFEQMTGRRLGGIGFLIDATRSRETPALRPTYGDADALNQYTANQWVYNKSIYNADEEITTGSLDVKRAFESARTPFQLQGGIKYQKQDRETETWLPSWTYVGTGGVLNVAQFGQAERGYGMRHGFYPAFQLLDFRPANALLNSQPGQFTPVGTSVAVRNPPSVATEEISSAYVMGKVDVRPFTLLGGVRAERTEIAARGAFTQAGVVSTTSREGEYTKYFPSVHVRYAATSNLALRASYSTTMARPGIADIVPTTTVTTSASTGLGAVTQNNTNLGPQYSKNVDVMVEYALAPVGLLSAGVFRKDVAGFILTQRDFVGGGRDNGFDGQFEGYDLITKRNLNHAIIKGYEVSYEQQLRMLPKPFNTLGLYANYTDVRTEGTYDEGAGALAGFVPKTYNGGLTYSLWRLQLRVNFNHTSGYLRAYNAAPASAAWLTSVERVGFNLQYRINGWLTATANLENAFNQAPDEYSLNTNRITVSEIFGSRLTLGVRGRF